MHAVSLRSSRWFSIGLVFAVVFVTRLALADGPDPERLFSEGTALMELGQFSEALPKFLEAQRLDPGIGTQFNLGICYEKTGKLGSAYRSYAEVLRLARAAGKKVREDAARAKLNELTKRVPALVIHGGAIADVSIRVDGAALNKDELPFYPVDAGRHTIEATAPGKQAWSSTVDSSTEGARVDVRVPELRATVARTKIVTVESTSGRRTVGLIVGGVGLAGLVAAGVTGVMLLDDKSTADALCTPQCATGEGRDAVARGKTLLPINAVAFGVGIVGVGLGTFFILTAGKKEEKPTASSSARRPIVVPGLGPYGASLTASIPF